jgi:hypothetical protein
LGVAFPARIDYTEAMTNNHFKTSALALAVASEAAGFPLSAYALLHITDRLVAAGVNFAEPAPPSGIETHDGRVALGLATPEVIDCLREGKSINAIKALREAGGRDGNNVALIGLKHAKEAVEDPRLKEAYYGIPK